MGRAADAMDVRVSGRCLDPSRWLIERHGLDAEAMLAGTDLPPDAWEHPPKRISWRDFAVVQERVATLVGSDTELREAGRSMVAQRGLGGIISMVSTLASPADMYAMAPRFGLATLVPMVEGHFEAVSTTCSRVVATIPVGYTPCPSFFEISAGNFESLPTLLGDPPAIVELRSDGARAVFLITHTPSRTLVARIKRVWNVLFGVEHLFRELVERNEELSQQLSLAAAAREQAERAIASQNALLAAVSHELRTPLAQVVGLIGLARDEVLPPVADGRLSQAKGAADRLLHTVNVLVQVAALGEAASEELDHPVCLGALVQEVSGQFRHQRGLQLQVDVSEGAATVVLAPVGWLESMLHELLGNAFKFTQQGQVSVGVSVQPTTDAHAVDLRLVVADTGPGIPADLHHRVFEPFVQGDRGLGRQAEGMGLGLTLVRALAERLSGSVQLASHPGRGTRVTVQLRLQTGHLESASLAPEDVIGPLDGPHLSLVEAPDPADGTHRYSLQPDDRGGVLVVDDSPVNRLLLCKLGERLGYRAASVDSGEAALLALKRDEFEIVFMDVQMPGLDGLGTAALLRGDRALAHLPVVAVTAQVAPGDEARCRAAGMDAYVPKPVEFSRLEAAVGEALEASRSRAVAHVASKVVEQGG